MFPKKKKINEKMKWARESQTVEDFVIAILQENETITHT